MIYFIVKNKYIIVTLLLKLIYLNKYIFFIYYIIFISLFK